MFGFSSHFTLSLLAYKLYGNDGLCRIILYNTKPIKLAPEEVHVSMLWDITFKAA